MLWDDAVDIFFVAHNLPIQNTVPFTYPCHFNAAQLLVRELSIWWSTRLGNSLCQTLDPNPFKLDPAPCYFPCLLRGLPWDKITLSQLQSNAGNFQPVEIWRCCVYLITYIYFGSFHWFIMNRKSYFRTYVVEVYLYKLYIPWRVKQKHSSEAVHNTTPRRPCIMWCGPTDRSI